MAMNFDTYSTSFQSLMNPMYNVNANYSFNGGYAGGAYGAGCMNPAMMGMYAMGPMAGVGVGQFKADYLLKGDDQLNNYYARPIAAHKKKDEMPTVLGILGTAIATAALITALVKGKGRRIPGRVKPPVVPPTPPAPPVVKPDVSRFGAQPYVAPKYLNPLTQPASVADRLSSPEAIKNGLSRPYIPVKPDVSKFGQQPYVAPKYLNPLTQPASVAYRLSSPEAIKNGLSRPYIPVKPDVSKFVQQPYVAPKYLNPATQPDFVGQIASPRAIKNQLRRQAALDKQAAAMNLPSSGQVYTTPVNNGQVLAGYLPAHNSKVQTALDKQAAAMNLPSSGKVYTTPLTPQQATAAGVMTPEAQAAYNRVLGQQFKPGLVKDAARKDAAWAFSGLNFDYTNAANRLKNNGLAFNPQAVGVMSTEKQNQLFNIISKSSNEQIQRIATNPRFKVFFS